MFACCALWWFAACANTAVGTDGGAVDAVSERVGGDAGVDALAPAMWPQPDPAAPRLIAPLSCTWHSSRRPTLRWALPPGVERVVVEVCADRPCQRVEHTLEVTGSSTRVPEELRPGAHFWRAFALVDGRRGAGSFTWEFRAPIRGTPADLAVATYVDVNGDGYGDALIPASSDTEAYTYVYFGGPSGLNRTPNQRLAYAIPKDIGDLNGDGFSDVILSRSWIEGEPLDPRRYARQVFLGSARGLVETSHTLEHPDFGTTLESGGAQLSSSLGDVNGDGYADVSTVNNLVVAIRGDRAWVHFGSRSGYDPRNSFEVAPPLPGLGVFGRIYPLGDFDGDNRPDFLLEGSRSATGFEPCVDFVVAGEHLQNPGTHARQLLPPPGYELGVVAITNRLRHCDLNRDGRAEVVLDSYRSGTARRLTFYTSVPGSGPIPPSRSVDGGELFSGGASLDVSCVPDLDGDGFNDLVGSRFPITDWWIRGSSTSTSAPEPVDNLSIHSKLSSRREATNDANGDGRADMLVTQPRVATVYAASSNGPPVEQYRLFVPMEPNATLNGFSLF